MERGACVAGLDDYLDVGFVFGTDQIRVDESLTQADLAVGMVDPTSLQVGNGDRQHLEPGHIRAFNYGAPVVGEAVNRRDQPDVDRRGIFRVQADVLGLPSNVDGEPVKFLSGDQDAPSG